MNISENKNDSVSLFFINWWLGIALSSDCQFEKAVFNLEKALKFNIFTNHLTLISVVKSVISHLCYFNWGKIDLAYQMSGEAVQVAEEVNDIHSLAMAYTAHGVCSYGKGYFEQAIEYLLKALDFSEKIDYFSYVSFSNLFLGKTYFEVGNFLKAGEHYDRGASALKRVNIMPTCMNLNKIGSIRSKVMNDEWNFDFEHLLTLTHGNRAKVFEGWIQRYIGEILLNCDDQCFLEAETCIQNAIEADNRNGMIWHLGGDHALHAELYKRKGDQIKARENLQKAIEIIQECGADGWVEKYQKELAAVS